MAEEIIIVQGTGVLTGEVPVSGAKNSALKLMAAALLGGGTTAIHNVPLISDIAIMSEVLRCLNARVEREGHTLSLIHICPGPAAASPQPRSQAAVSG